MAGFAGATKPNSYGGTVFRFGRSATLPAGGVGSSNPVLHTWIGAACDKGLFGWPCDPEIEKLRNAFGMASSEDDRKKIAKELQTKAMEQVVYIPFGQWDQPLAYRADRIDGIVPNTGLTVLWGITKK